MGKAPARIINEKEPAVETSQGRTLQTGEIAHTGFQNEASAMPNEKGPCLPHGRDQE